MLVIFLFFCSGASALIYEVIWSRYLALMLGSTVQAQTMVLAVFMGGLAIGNRIFGRRADTLPSPLAWYGLMEVSIGLYAFFFHSLYRGADALFVGLGSALINQGVLLLLVKAALSVLLLLFPTILMGGTLPLLAAWLQRQSADAGRWSARFYSTNSLGAVAGAALAGFYLVRNLGLVSSLQMTALANVTVGFVAWALSRREVQWVVPGEGRSAPVAAVTPSAGAPRSLAWACWMVAFTGGVSMAFEVLAARSLILIFGASLQAFAIVLVSFILGIGLGSACIASPRWRHLRPVQTTMLLLLVAATLISVLVLGIERWVEFYVLAKSGLAETSVGFRFHQLLAAAMSIVVLGLPAALIGAVLPLWIRSLAQGSEQLGNQVGRLLTWNTIGAVVGVLLTGFLLMPLWGLRAAFFVLVVALCLAASFSVWADQRRWLSLAPLGLGAAVIVVAAFTGESWRHVLGSGVFRLHGSEIDPQMLVRRRQHIELLYYQDAADATVSVERIHGTSADGDIGLRINGKVDASSRVDLATQYLLAHLPLLARPESKDVFVLGLGSGITAGALLSHPVERITIAENCRPVVKAASWFAPWNRGILTNHLARIWNEDARTILKLSPQMYDVIISEPSNPWMAGIGSVFSREFYQLAAARLKEGGIMTQWFHIYEMNDGIVALVLRTFASVFPFVEIWDPGSGDIILLGSTRPWASNPQVYRRIFDREGPRRDLETIGLKTPETVWARQLASQRTAFAIADRGAMQSDAFPILEYEAPKAFYMASSSQLLNVFDERTWQADIAAPEKRAALAALSDELLKPVFAQFSSVNPYLNKYIDWHFKPEARAGTDVFVGRRLMPTAFRKRYPTEAEDLHASDDWTRALRAEQQLHATPEQWQEAVGTLESILRGQKPGQTKALGWAPASFAATAVKACLARGEIQRAKELLALGLRLDPEAHELNYLVRILEREGILPPAPGLRAEGN